MSPWEAWLLGAVQGATEFLPVSSSGHLVITQELLGIVIPGVFFEVAVHVATLLSVLVAYRERVGRLVVGGLRGEAEAWRYILLLGVATVPAAFVGLLFGEAVEALFETPVVPGVALLVTGALLFSTRWALEPGRRSAAENGDGDEGALERAAATPDPGTPAGIGGFGGVPGIRVALLMGIAQAFALVPGISRSGTTVVMGLWLRVEAREAAAFSFLMAIPAIAGAAVLQAPELLEGSSRLPGGVLLGGAVAAAVTGVLAIRTFVAMLRHRAFHRFAWYCWAVGAGFLLYLLAT